MSTTDKNMNVVDREECLRFLNDVNETLQKFCYQNDHVVRGPLCRILGLIDLLQRENFNPDARQLLDMLEYEVGRIEAATLMISRNLNMHEDNVQKMINELKNKKPE